MLSYTASSNFGGAENVVEYGSGGNAVELIRNIGIETCLPGKTAFLGCGAQSER